MTINIIAAIGKNLELGKNNKLIWFIKEDLKYFKDKTLGKTVVMGENTYNSIGKPLSNRKNIVLSYEEKQIKDVVVINDYKDIFKLSDEEIFIIGGASVYKLFLPYAENLYLTEIEEEDNDADCYFPVFDKSLYDKEIIKTVRTVDICYSFVCYKRKELR